MLMVFPKLYRTMLCRHLPHKLGCLLMTCLLALVGGAQGVLRVGYAILTSDAGSSLPAGAALLRTTTPQGVIISETWMEAVLPLGSGLVYVDE